MGTPSELPYNIGLKKSKLYQLLAEITRHLERISHFCNTLLHISS